MNRSLILPLFVSATFAARSVATGAASARARELDPSSAGAPKLLRDMLGQITMAGTLTCDEKTRNILVLDPGAANRTVTLPSDADGRLFFVQHAGDDNEVVTINDASAVLVTKLYQGGSVLLYCEGGTWYYAYVSAPNLTRRPFQTIDMADAALALVYSGAGAGQADLVADVLFVDPNSGGASEDLTLPPVATSKGRGLRIHNTGGEDIVVKDPGGAAVATVSTAESGFFDCNGTLWYGGVVKAT